MNDAPELFAATVHSSQVDKPPGKIGGCVGTFLQLFDWNPRKRLFSTKRLPAERPNGRKASSSKKKYKDERMPVAKLLLLAEEENRGGFPSPKKISSASSGDRIISEDGMTGKRVPGVVARLMGLESLPDERGAEGKISPQHKNLASVEVRPLQELLHARQEPVLLSDLLREREYLEATKMSLKDRLHVPVAGFVKKPEPVPQMSNYVPLKDGFKKPIRSESPHLQPYSDQKYHKSLRPLKKTSRDLTDTKHLILALSPRANGESLRPILLPSKVHNKLMSSPIKSPTKMGSRSARLLEAAVKILEPSLQSSTTRTRGSSPPVRPSSVSARDFRDLESEVAAGMTEERREREKTVLVDRKTTMPSNAARSLKGQSMSRSWNGREEAGKFSHDYKSSSHEGRRKNDQHTHGSQSRTASPMRSTSQRTRSRNVVPQEDISVRTVEEVKTVVPHGFEEAYGGGLKPLNVGRREEIRLDKYEVEDRRVSEKHVVSTLATVNSPYSECSERSTTSSSYHDPLRRSGSAKEGPVPSTPATSNKTRFMRSKSVKEEKSTKPSGAGGGSLSSHHHSRASNRDVRVKQEIPQQAHQSHPSHYAPQAHQGHHQSHQHHQAYEHPVLQGSMHVPEAPVVQESPPPQKIEALIAQRDPFQPESESVSIKTIQTPVIETVRQEPEVLILQQSPKPVPTAEVDISADESVSSRSSHVSSVSQLSGISLSKEGSVAGRTSSGGGMLYNRLFGNRKGGEKKSDGKEKSKSRSDGPKRTESSLVRSLLRRKSPAHSASLASTSVSPPAPVKSMEKPKKRGAKNVSLSEPPSRVLSDAETPGYLSEDCSMDIDCDVEAALLAHKERVFQRESDMNKQSPLKSINDVFPEIPLDKGCLRLLDEVDESGSQRIPIEGFDCVVDDDPDDRIRGEIMSYAAHLIDDLKLEEMFSTGAGFQGSGRHGFSYSPLVELEEPPRSSLETFILDEGTEVEKCVSFLGRTRSLASSPELSFIKRELYAEEPDHDDQVSCKSEHQLLRASPSVDVVDELASEDPKDALLNELTEARKIVDEALEEATERVSKKFTAKGRVVLEDVDEDEAVCASSVTTEDSGQPSPVSVLDCLFEEDETRSPEGSVHETICEMEVETFEEDDDEDSLMDDLLFESAAALVPRKQRKPRKKLPTLTVVTVADSEDNVKTHNEKIVDAILDMSRLRSPDSCATSCGLFLGSSDEFREEEEDYVRKILSVFEVFPETSGNGAGAELPIASTLFDRLESQGRASAWQREKEREQFGSPEVGAPDSHLSFKQWQGLWLHRRLLFDCVNETMAYRLKYKYPDPWVGIPILRDPPKGQALANDVYTEIKNWRDVQTEELDTIIELDMTRGFGNWSNLNQEIAEIGLEIERTILRVMIEELVTEIMGASNAAKFCSVRG